MSTLDPLVTDVAYLNSIEDDTAHQNGEALRFIFDTFTLEQIL